MNDLAFEDLNTYRDELTKVMAGATRSVSWLDGDLAETGAHEQANAQALRHLLAGSPQARVRLLLLSESWFWRYCPRLVELLNTYGHAFSIRTLSESDSNTPDRFLLTDNAVVRRFHPENPRGETSIQGRTMAQCHQEFELFWQRAEPAGEGRRLFI
ncbi:DUF7931 domain-containing protein [Chitinimonas naiadis]